MLIRFLALIAAISFAVYWFNIRMRPEDAAAYHELVQESSDLRKCGALDANPAYQKRRGVQKDIWSESEMRHFQIQSEQSELTLQKGGAVEQLEKIHCQLEDGFVLSADEGTYRFPSHQFTARNHCHLVQNENQIDGTSIHVDLHKEILTYENPKGHLASGPLDFTADRLIWHKKEGKLHLVNHVAIEQTGQFALVADKGTVTLDAFQPVLILLEGNVCLVSSRIQDKESHAIADTLTYNPSDKTLLFSAEKKVFFWQDGLSLSAPEILIRENQTVEGRGDVHFTFDLEEQNYIDELFKQYL